MLFEGITNTEIKQVFLINKNIYSSVMRVQ